MHTKNFIYSGNTLLTNQNYFNKKWEMNFKLQFAFESLHTLLKYFVKFVSNITTNDSSLIIVLTLNMAEITVCRRGSMNSLNMFSSSQQVWGVSTRVVTFSWFIVLIPPHDKNLIVPLALCCDQRKEAPHAFIVICGSRNLFNCTSPKDDKLKTWWTKCLFLL